MCGKCDIEEGRERGREGEGEGGKGRKDGREGGRKGGMERGGWKGRVREHTHTPDQDEWSNCSSLPTVWPVLY